MTAQARRVVREALEFSPEERADVAAELLASLDEPLEESVEDTEKAWAVEIERRARRVLAGESAGTGWDEVRARIEKSILER